MHGWQHPLGPDSERTYWLRRAAVVAGVVLLVALVVAAAVRAATPHAPAPTPPAPTPALTSARASTPAPTPTPTPSVAPTTPAESPSPTPSPTPTATPTPGPCAADQVALAITGDRSPRSTENAHWTLTITNVSDASCHLEVSADNTVVTVTSGAVRVWSTQDCGDWLHAPQAAWVEPGKAVEWGIDWPTKLSSSGCKLSEQYLKPGTYVARASYADSAQASLVVALRG